MIKSTAFDHEGFIPSKYTCEGDNINPPLDIFGIPEETKTMVLMIEDPDAPKGVFDHWLVWNILPMETIAENSIPGVVGTNGFGTTQYLGPCPPTGIHRYFFKLYALDKALNLPEGANKIELLEAMNGHILTMNEYMGRYQKKINSK